MRVVDRGSYLRVGDGATIFFVTDPCFPSSSRFTMKGFIDSCLYGLVVGGLMNNAMEKWDTKKIKVLFGDRHVKAIIQIPISKHGMVDRLIWSDANNGKMTVRVRLF